MSTKLSLKSKTKKIGNDVKEKFSKEHMKESFENKKEEVAVKTVYKRDNIKHFFQTANSNVFASMCLMGLGQLMYKQIVKGLIYLSFEILSIVYFVMYGGKAIYNFFTLGLITGDPWLEIAGDNSVVMMLMGILTWFIVVLTIVMYYTNIKDVYNTQIRVLKGGMPEKIGESLAQLADKKFYKTILALPLIGVLIFNVLPIIFMILIAFTDYGGDIVPPELISWVGLENFEKLATLGEIAPTFLKILSWNLLWAFSSTFINYALGLGLAILLNKKCVKGKAIWRGFPILAYAIPGFITLIGFKFMFSVGGPINQIISDAGGDVISFLGIDAKWTARAIGLVVNAWISVPTIMLLTTGILSNMNTDLYEAAEIDGASKRKQFFKITLPFVIFSTTPVLISQFIGNFNNFGIFYFLRGGLTLDGYFLASDTDLLINWLYNLSIDNNYYAIGAAISLVIFIITSAVSLGVYVRSDAYKKEDTFR